MRTALLALLLAAPTGAAAPGEGGWDWKETLTPHFAVEHQSTWLPMGLTMGLERINFRLGMDLGAFENWSSGGKISVYLYKDQESYAHGRFSPPPWSDGVAVYDQRAVAIPAMRETSQMLRVLAHETTHLIFVNYFRQAKRDPPNWVNEGLAMLEEADSPQKPETSSWYQSMVATEPGRWLPMATFFAINPTRDLGNDKKLVERFYVQSYSVTHFLVRKHTHMQFKAFCDHLRDGQSAEEAMRLAFDYRDAQDFERRWRQWVALPEHKRRVDALPMALRSQDSGVVEQGASRSPAAGSAFRSGLGGGSSGGSFSNWQIQSRSVFPSQGASAPAPSGQ